MTHIIPKSGKIIKYFRNKCKALISLEKLKYHSTKIILIIPSAKKSVELFFVLCLYFRETKKARYQMNIGMKLLEARKRKNLTLAKLSKIVNIPISSLSGYERGKGPSITDSAMIKISIALNDTSILIDQCRFCLVRSHILQEHYPGIDFHRRDPKQITKRLHMDVAAAAEAAKRLQVRHSDLDIQMISELRRSIELWEYELVLATYDDQLGSGQDGHAA